MQSVTAALTWEYLARNRWILLLFPLGTMLLALFTMLPVRGLLLASGPERAIVALHLINVLCLVLIINAGVLATQGNVSRLYLKPISTTAIVNFFYWGGALLVAVQVALVLWIWKVFFVSDWPILGSVLFAIVCWGAFQPIFRGTMYSFWWIVAAMAIVVGLTYWLLARHGIPLKRGGMLSHDIQYWNVLSWADSLIAIVTLSVSYVLTVWRIHYDRSGRRPQMLDDRVGEILEYINSQRGSRPRQFRSPVHAHQWFDIQSRTFIIPAVVFTTIILSWTVQLINLAIPQSPVHSLGGAMVGTYSAAIVQIFSALFIAMCRPIYVLAQYGFTNGELRIEKFFPSGMSPYLSSLPMTSRQRSQAILRSSAWACGMASALVLASFTLIGGLSWGVGIDPMQFSQEQPLKLRVAFPWFVIFVSGGSLLLSFIFANLTCSFDFRKVMLRNWTTPMILIAMLLASFTPFVLPLSIGLCAIAAGYLIYATFRALINEDISWVGAGLVWLAGAASVALAWYGLKGAVGVEGGVLAMTLLALAMLPFFSTASTLREFRKF